MLRCSILNLLSLDLIIKKIFFFALLTARTFLFTVFFLLKLAF